MFLSFSIYVVAVELHPAMEGYYRAHSVFTLIIDIFKTDYAIVFRR